MAGPVDYSLCSQTVTVYSLRGDQVQRTVYEGAHLQLCDEVSHGDLGRQQERKFLLILPGEGVCLAPGDRVFDGVGPQITADRWHGFIPPLVPGLGEIAYVRPYYWQGTLCHTEAGR